MNILADPLLPRVPGHGRMDQLLTTLTGIQLNHLVAMKTAWLSIIIITDTGMTDLVMTQIIMFVRFE
jgi:hypothetical protein